MAHIEPVRTASTRTREPYPFYATSRPSNSPCTPPPTYSIPLQPLPQYKATSGTRNLDGATSTAGDTTTTDTEGSKPTEDKRSRRREVIDGILCAIAICLANILGFVYLPLVFGPQFKNDTTLDARILKYFFASWPLLWLGWLGSFVWWCKVGARAGLMGCPLVLPWALAMVALPLFGAAVFH